MNILQDLQWRGLLSDCTANDALAKRLEEGPIVLYSGFDPTADSLHVGNLVPLVALRRFQLAGHTPIALAGGATGSIGDPSGKASERQLLSEEAIARNIAKVKRQLARLLDFSPSLPNAATLVDNAEWMKPMGLLDFLRDVGKRFTVNSMVAKESVRARMDDREAGISYTEFSYMLLQAYDFLHLYRARNCELQIGGSDQWGNITAGVELVRKTAGQTAFGLTLPLILNADGTKFGKSEEGAIWLDPAKTSVYRFYQYFINVDDRDAVRYLKLFTLLDREAIEALEARHRENPGSRDAHRALAREITRLVHGPDAAEDAANASRILFGGALDDVSETALEEAAREIPSARVPPDILEADGLPLVDALVQCGLSPSKGQARKDIQAGGVYVNNIRIQYVNRSLTLADVHFGKYLLLRHGKKRYAALLLEPAPAA